MATSRNISGYISDFPGISLNTESFPCAGGGKSTLLSLACGLLKPESGSVRLSAQSSGNERGKINDIRKNQGGNNHSTGASRIIPIGYMFQKDHLFEWRTLYQNVMLGPELHHQKTPETISRVRQMIDFYGLGEFTDSSPSALSGGMRQRAALIRTLALEPSLLILDEPFSALDYQTRLDVTEDITSLIRRSGKTVLMVTHDLSEAVSVADRILVLSKRPCSLKADIPVSFPGQITSPERRREHPYFSVLFNQVWKELKKKHVSSS